MRARLLPFDYAVRNLALVVLSQVATMTGALSELLTRQRRTMSLPPAVEHQSPHASSVPR